MQSDKEIKELIDSASEQYGINRSFLHALVLTESCYNPFAIRYEPSYVWTLDVPVFARSVGCSVETMRAMQMTSWGLCQIMGSVAFELGFIGWCTELLMPQVNLKWACKYIDKLCVKQALRDPLDMYAAYNAGSVRKIEGRYVNQWAVNRFKKNLASI